MLRNSLCVGAAVLLTACSTLNGASTGVVPISDGLYMSSKQGGAGLNWSGAKLKVELYQEGAQFCEKNGKKFSLVSDSSQDASMYSYPSAEIKFRCE